MNKLLVAFILWFIPFFLCGQPCFSDGITFSNQRQIDSFFVDFPDCSVIEGDVSISQNSIRSLVGLAGLKEINGSLNINFLTDLNSLRGLDSLRRIGGDLRITYVNKLKDFQGLNNLQQVGGRVQIDINSGIESFVGFNQLRDIGSDLTIHSNDGLLNTDGFDSLRTVRAINITQNTSLREISGFPVLSKIEFRLMIQYIDSLKVISGFNKLDTIGGGLVIDGCRKLELISAFNQLNHIGEKLELKFNRNLLEISGLRELKRVGGLRLFGSSLTSFENFQNLTVIGGDFYLGEDSVKTLNGFERLDSILGSININNCIKLESLNGFEALSYIAGYLSIDRNPSLSSLIALKKLNHISEGLSVSYNPLLKSLNGLNNLPSVKGVLWIRNNSELESISGIRQINPEEITELILTDNPKLSICYEESICQYLQIAPENNATIQNNLSGCNSKMEVLTECALIATRKEQFEFRLQYMADSNDSTWGVYVKPKAGFMVGSNDVIVGSGQVTILMLDDGKDSIDNIQSVSGDWYWRSYDGKVESPCEAPGTSYFFIKLRDGDGIVLEDSKETLLFTFQIPSGCPTTIDLLDNNTDPFMPHLSDNCHGNGVGKNSEGISPRQDLSVFNATTGRIHNWYGNYNLDAYSCEECTLDINFNCPPDTIAYDIMPDSTGYPIVNNQCLFDTIYYADGNQIEFCSDTTVTFSRFWTLKNITGQSYNCTQKITILKDFSKITIPNDTILSDCFPINELTNHITGYPTYLGKNLSTEDYQFGLLIFQSDEILSNSQLRRYFKVYDWCTPTRPPVDIGSQLITFPSIGDEDNDTVIDCVDLCKGGDDRINSDGLGMPDDCDCNPNNPDDEFVEINQISSLNGLPIDTIYHASFQISSTGNLLQGDSITFYAGNSIILKAGFYAPFGSRFVAAIDQDCSKRSSLVDSNVLSASNLNNSYQPISETEDLTVPLSM